MVLDFAVRAKIAQLEAWLKENAPAGFVESSPGVRSALLEYDPLTMPLASMLELLQQCASMLGPSDIGSVVDYRIESQNPDLFHLAHLQPQLQFPTVVIYTAQVVFQNALVNTVALPCDSTYEPSAVIRGPRFYPGFQQWRLRVQGGGGHPRRVPAEDQVARAAAAHGFPRVLQQGRHGQVRTVRTARGSVPPRQCPLRRRNQRPRGALRRYNKNAFFSVGTVGV